MHAATFDKAHEKLRIILERLRRAGLTINREKCLFFPRELKYLGQLIKDGTLTLNPKRVAALRAWDNPTNVAGLRSLLGFLNYYQTYIPRYAATLAPLNYYEDIKNKLIVSYPHRQSLGPQTAPTQSIKLSTTSVSPSSTFPSIPTSSS